MTTKQYFTQMEILKDMREAISGSKLKCYDDLIVEALNKDYYISDRHEAEKALEQYGITKAIGKVENHELNVYGETRTKLSDPKVLASMLYLVLGTETLYNDYPDLDGAFFDVVDCEISEENDKILLDEIDKLIDYLE